MMKVIITGAAGFIGGALTKRLLSQGVTVYGVDISSERLEEMKQYGDFIPVVADFSMYGKLHELIPEAEYDLCIHSAWKGRIGGADLYDYALQNSSVDATCTLCDMCAKIGVKRIVFCSSSYQEMISESFSQPINYYGIAKKTAAAYCMAISKRSKIECNIAVLTNTYGNGDRSQKAVNTFIRKMLAGESIDLVHGTSRNDWCYIDDTVNGILAAARSKNAFRYYYVGHREISTFKEKLIDMKSALDSASELNFGKYSDDTFVDYEKFELDLLHDETGFECKTEFKDSIKLTAQWIKKLDNL